MADASGSRSVEESWQTFARGIREQHRPFFDGEGPVIGARAPGRLDVMGGVADYSGSVVLEGTLAEATFVAVQARADGLLKIKSVGAAGEGLREEAVVPLSALI